MYIYRKSGKIVVDSGEVSSVKNVYGVGDVIEKGIELTPVAIRAGKLIARVSYDFRRLCSQREQIVGAGF